MLCCAAAPAAAGVLGRAQLCAQLCAMLSVIAECLCSQIMIGGTFCWTVVAQPHALEWQTRRHLAGHHAMLAHMHDTEVV